MAEVTSSISQTRVGPSVRNKKNIFTATKVTGPNGSPPVYTTSIIKYDDANGTNPRVIGTRNSNQSKIQWNNNATSTDKRYSNKISQTSSNQVQSIEKDLTSTAQQKDALRNASGQKNKANKDSEGKEGDKDKREGISLKDATQKLKDMTAESAVGTKDSGFGIHVYPKTLRQDNNGQDYMKFDMLKYEPTDINTDKFAVADRESNRKSIGTVMLPIPAGIQDGFSVSWSNDSMTALDLAKANIALETITGGPGAGIDELSKQVSKASGASGEVGAALAATIAGMASGAGNLLTRTTGAIMNPNMELLFTGPNLRTFSFQFLLAPRDDKEAKTVIKILRFFKQGMAPIRSKSRLFLKSPHTFRLSYRNSRGTQHKYLNKFKECALQSFGVDYAPNGNYSTYEDGIMTAYRMTMTYSELQPIYNDDYGVNFPAEIGF
tara:strand:- start:1103 stop:2410 length:1308 start_codon:yes stop_codon:yes gene_type:complete